MNKVKLFCFPYAGGSATIYAKWKRFLNPSIELCPVEMAGRGSRFGEPLKCSMEEVINDLYCLLRKDLDTSTYMLFGHSFGTAVICELMDRIHAYGHRKPLHIFVSGRYPPHIPQGNPIFDLPEDDFIRDIAKMGGMPTDILENKELLKIFLPVLRADYQAIETYEYIRKDYLWDVDISVLNGTQDEDIKLCDVLEWRNYTNGRCKIYSFEGGHFFIHDYMNEIVTLINNTK